VTFYETKIVVFARFFSKSVMADMLGSTCQVGHYYDSDVMFYRQCHSQFLGSVLESDFRISKAWTCPWRNFGSAIPGLSEKAIEVW
jgi:hypothetical protein